MTILFATRKTTIQNFETLLVVVIYSRAIRTFEKTGLFPYFNVVHYLLI
jgi:hypothetical protein